MKSQDPELNGSNHSLDLVCSLLLHECNFDFLVTFPNIWTLPHFQRIY